jgi:hypothetical protein
MRIKPKCELWNNDLVFPDSDGCMAGDYKPLLIGKTVEAAFMFGGFPCTIREVEPCGKLVDEGKLIAVAHGVTNGKQIRVPWVQAVNAFVLTYASMKFLDAHEPPLKEWRVFGASKDAKKAIGKTRLDCEPDAHLDSVDCSDRDFAYAAMARALEAVLEERYRKEPVGSLIDAVQFAMLSLYTGLPLDEKAVAERRRLWEVWERGYGLFGSVGGVMYVYRKY